MHFMFGRQDTRYLPTRVTALLAIFFAEAFHGCLASDFLRSLTRRDATSLSKTDQPRRFFSVGDLHGDAKHASEILRALGLMDERGDWAGGKAVLVQTGDVVDRGGHSRQIYDLLFKLQDQAPTHGGEVVLLLGNHELMHMQGDTNYMTDEDASGFGGMASCEAAFGPDGWLGARLRQRNQVAALIGHKHGLAEPVVYVHGGVLSSIASAFAGKVSSLAELRAHTKEEASRLGQETMGALNEAARALLIGKGEAELSSEHSFLLGDNGPLWTRKLALGQVSCEDLVKTLSLFNATRMVVGHTAQEDGQIHHRCGGRLVLADTMISEAYDGTSHMSALEVEPSGCAFALYPAQGMRRETLPCLAGAHAGAD